MYEVRTNVKGTGVAEFNEADYIAMLKALQMIEKMGTGTITVLYVDDEHLQFEVKTPIKKVQYRVWKYK